MTRRLILGHPLAMPVGTPRGRRLAGWSVPALALAAVSLGTPAANAQGTLSTLGFGYPVGAASIRVNGTAGAFGEFDPLSAINPAAIGGIQRAVIGAQAEPERRTVTIGAARERSNVQRVPLIAVLFPAGKGFGVALSGSAFLDRSHVTTTTGSVSIDGRPVPTTDFENAKGAISDMRAAVGWERARVKVGLAGHLLTGSHLVARTRTFSDSLQYGGVVDSSRAAYTGTALSMGAEVRLPAGVALLGSWRAGGTLDARIRDTVRTAGSVPRRLGLGVRFDGIPGAVFAAGIEEVRWTDMAPLGSAAVRTQDATNWKLGVEVAGPRLRESPVLVRAGVARTALPFGTAALAVRESRASMGVGVPIARESAMLDLSIQRAVRSPSAGTARERAWLLGIGLQVRP